MAASPDVTLLVDGYNIIGAWTPLAFCRDRNGLEAAREELIGELANYSAFQGYQTRIIFDAHQRRESYGNSELITDALEIFYTEFGETADSHIEQFCARARFQSRASQHRLIVATNDRAQQLTVLGYGAEWMSAQQLISDIEGIALRIQRQQKSNKKTSARLLSHSLDPAAKRKLERWRHGLS
ncbi:NYN domain-containing protein [Altericista sp. CCNU0014]|uniref:NYN domain-containing protein n=1 Tax=Altericista sp. CCNU0014 TaxID=3082949 RepID=UPI00384CC481